jgi:alcohol dehydrogenase class IV
MERFDWRDGQRVVHFGRGRLAEAVDLLGGPGYTLLTTKRAADLTLTEAAEAVHMVGAGRVDELADALLDEVTGERIVALGGGRVIDTAKAVAAGLGGARVLAVPTTLSGAEMTWVHRHATRVAADTARVRPAVVVYDPAVAASQPVGELAASALNALGHAAEAPCTTLASPVPTLMALEAARLIGGGFEAEPDRDGLALAALLAGAAIDSAWYGLHHVLSQTAVRLCDVGHGPANAILLPHTLEALGRRFPDQHVRLGEALGGEPSAVAARICALTGATRLAELGVTEAQLDACADAAADRGELELTPPRADRDELRAIYAAAL